MDGWRGPDWVFEKYAVRHLGEGVSSFHSPAEALGYPCLRASPADGNHCPLAERTRARQPHCTPERVTAPNARVNPDGTASEEGAEKDLTGGWSGLGSGRSCR